MKKFLNQLHQNICYIVFGFGWTSLIMGIVIPLGKYKDIFPKFISTSFLISGLIMLGFTSYAIMLDSKETKADN
jgi:hypothetical protein